MNTSFFLRLETIAALTLITALHGYTQSVYEPYTFVTIAGRSGVRGNKDGLGRTARFYGPSEMALDNAGNLYVPDLGNNTIRRLSRVGDDWVVTTLAGRPEITGFADGTNNVARFNHPAKVALDSAGNLYVTDRDNHTIREVTSVGTNWVVTTLAGRPGMAGIVDGTNSQARFSSPWGLAIDSPTNIYVTDYPGTTIRRLTQYGTNWVVTTIAGNKTNAKSIDGTNTAASFAAIGDLAMGPEQILYVVEGVGTVRRIMPVGTNWVVTTLAGRAGTSGSTDGLGSVARFNDPEALAVDNAGNIYVCEVGNNIIRKVSPLGTNWIVTTLAGKPRIYGSQDGTGSAARFYAPSVAVDSAGNLYEADFIDNWVIRMGYPALAMRSRKSDFGFTQGLFGFELAGRAGRLAVVEASGDLRNWTPVWTNTLAPDLHFSDPTPGNPRFYRAYMK
jgi:hypothetical protein